MTRVNNSYCISITNTNSAACSESRPVIFLEYIWNVFVLKEINQLIDITVFTFQIDSGRNVNQADRRHHFMYCMNWIGIDWGQVEVFH